MDGGMEAPFLCSNLFGMIELDGWMDGWGLFGEAAFRFFLLVTFDEDDVGSPEGGGLICFLICIRMLTQMLVALH